MEPAAQRLDVNTILRLAAEEFAANGYDGMSMRTLAERCSVTAAAIYYHFSSKEALYDEVCTWIFEKVVSTVVTETNAARSPEEKIEKFVLTLFDEWNKDRIALILTMRDAVNASVRRDQSYAFPQYLRSVVAIKDVLSQMTGAEVDEATAFTFMSMLFGFCCLMAYPATESGMSNTDYVKARREKLLEFSKLFLIGLAPKGETIRN